jgi:hypothetical protein
MAHSRRHLCMKNHVVASSVMPNAHRGGFLSPFVSFICITHISPASTTDTGMA